MLFNKLFGDKKPPKSPDTSPSVSSERAVSPWEAQNEETIDELANFIDFAEGFTVGFIEVSFPEDIENLLKVLRLRPECRNVKFHIFDFSDPNLTYLKDELIQRINQLPQPISTLLTPKRIILVKGLENSIGMFGDYPPVLQDLNFVRDALADSVQYPVLFCLPSYAINRVIKYAPDFWSWKSGVFRILANQDQQDEASIYALHAQKMLGATSQLERQERIKLLEKLAQEFDPLEGNRSKADLRIAAQALVTLASINILLGDFLQAKSSLDKADSIFEKYEWQPEANRDLAIRIKFLNEQGRLAFHLGQFAISEKNFEQALALNINIDLHLKGDSYNYLGLLKDQKGNLEEALALFQRSLDIYEYSGSALGQATSISYIGRIRGNLGQLEEALDMFQQSLEISERIGHIQNKAAILNDIGRIKEDQNYLEEALDMFQQSLEILERLGHVQSKAAVLNGIGRIKAEQGQVEEALDMFQQSLAISEHIESAWGQAASLQEIAYVEASRGKVGEAETLYQEALHTSRDLGLAFNTAKTLRKYAELLADHKGDFATAISYLKESLEIFQRIGSPKADEVQATLERVQSQANKA